MWISRLALTNYKNLSLNIKASNGLNIIHAANGAGKTNILEAINYFSTGNSFRGVEDYYIYPFEKEIAFSSAEIALNRFDLVENLKVVWTPPVAKNYWFNSRKSNLAMFKKNIKTMVHAPATIDIMIGGAKLRRDFLDNLILQLNPASYKSLFSNYRRIVLQKSRLLQQDRIDLNSSQFVQQLNYWNSLLLEHGTQIAAQRIELLRTLMPLMSDIAARIYSLSDYEAHFNLVSRYLPENIATETLTGNDLVQLIRESFTEKLTISTAKEQASGRVLYGPHLDDVEFKLGIRSVRYSCSRGQQRLFSLILHLSAVELLESEIEDKVILLLDDIFSELDPVHRHNTLQTVVERATSDSPNQIFLAIPEKADLNIPKSANYIKLA